MTNAYAFLFDGSLDGLPEPQLPFFTAAVFDAVSEADPAGSVSAQFRLGLPSLLGFSERTTAVHGTIKSSGRTVSRDLDTYKLIILQWLESLDGGWSSIDRVQSERIFRRHTYECVALSALTDDVRDRVDAALKLVPGYVGGFTLDPGNPLHRGGFFELLIYGAAILDGAVVQERTFEGDEDWALEGADRFKPGGLIWEDYGWLRANGPEGLPKTGLSDRGASTASTLARKHAPSIEQRVMEALNEALFLNRSNKTYNFTTSGGPDDILEAIMPEGKFTKYLFDRTHTDGGSKADFIIDTLGIEPEDWRYLAAQFYFGLAVADPEAVKLNEWKDGYGARFDVVMRVRSRSGAIGVLVTGWNFNPGSLPSLSTAHPGKRDASAIEPGDPPILPPGARSDADWAQLWEWANNHGVRAAAALVPTPMYIVGYEPIAEGEIGSAAVRVADARRGLARWLSRDGPGMKDGYPGIVVFSPVASQSFDRAVAWARAVTLVLRLNGIDAVVETFKN
ncbi:hypothetical protein EAH79_14255 [Sphingomonas koreensis]|nr:hypothetical protein EAH79_14255 [Sphingomonas koreensis]